MEKIYLNEIYIYYKELFTEKQQMYFDDYYLNDLSLSEIAENYGVSRNAVHNQLKIVEEKIIYSCGFYKTKAKDIKEMAIMIRDVFGGRVPDSIEKLTSLPGVGRKTANLIMGDVYKQPAIVADTHLIRITNLIGLVETKDPKKVEIELKKIIAGEKSNDFCHRMVLHGRAVCIARRPQCHKCCIKDYCKTGNKK